MRLRSRRRWLTLLLISFALGLASRVEASDGMRGDRCVVGRTDTIEEDFYFACRILDVRGTIDGDLIGIGSQITLHPGSVVTGDLWVGGGKLLIEGTVGDDIHFGGLALGVATSARFTDSRIDVAAAALDVNLARDAVLPGDLLVYGYQVIVSGTVGGDIDFGGETLIVEGVVSGRIDAEVGDSRRRPNVPDLPIYDISFRNPGLVIGPDAVVNGDIRYKTTRPSVIPVGRVHGDVTFVPAGNRPDITQASRPEAAAEILGRYLLESVRDLVTLVILGGLALWVLPGFVRQPASEVRRRTITTIGWGLATFMLAIPLLIVILVAGLLLALILYLLKLSALTILVGISLLVVSSGLVSGFSLLLFFLGRIVVCYMIGQLVYRYGLRIRESSEYLRWLSILAVGTACYTLLTNIPLPALGVIIEVVTVLAGIGAVVMYGRTQLASSPLVLSRFGPSNPVERVTVFVAPAPPPEDDALPPGMANLPAGFKGFDEDW